MASRFLRTPWVLAAVLGVRSAAAEGTSRELDRQKVVELASERAPNVVVAERRVDEARALRVGASAPSTTNPEISAYVGPRWLTPRTGTDFSIGISVPIDVSGAPSQRGRVADARARAAEREAELVRRSAMIEALDLWVQARGAEERAKLEEARLVVDRSFLRAAEARRAAGTVGDGDVALARVFEAQGVARKAAAERERDALVERLRARLSIPKEDTIHVVGALTPDALPPLESLIARVKNQPTVVAALATKEVAEFDERLQRRVGTPVPRVTASTGQDPETFLHVGLDVPIPLFQRNQTNVAVSHARVATTRAEYDAALWLTEAELRASYIEYRGALEALQALDAATPSVDDAEHLATRAYQLGQSTLTDVAATRREVLAARIARIDAQIALARTRVKVDAIAGTLP